MFLHLLLALLGLHHHAGGLDWWRPRHFVPPVPHWQRVPVPASTCSPDFSVCTG